MQRIHCRGHQTHVCSPHLVLIFREAWGGAGAAGWEGQEAHPAACLHVPRPLRQRVRRRAGPLPGLRRHQMALGQRLLR